MLGSEKEESSLEALKKRLYTRGSISRRPLRKGRLPAHEDGMTEDWSKDTPDIYPRTPRNEKIETSMFKKLFIGSLVFFTLAIAYAGYQFLAGGNLVSSKNINIYVVGPAFVSGGDELTLQVSLENTNNVPLEFAQLFIEYPKGAGSKTSSTTPDMVRKQLPLPKIAAGEMHQEIVKAILYGEEGSEQLIKFTFEYRVQGSNAIFRKESVYPVRISSAPINLSLEAPSNVNSNQEMIMNIKVSSNAPKDVTGVLLEADYPPGFLFKDANPKPTYGNNVWRLGDFSAGSSRSVRITGTLSGEDGDERTVRILSGSVSSDDEKTIGVVYNSIFQTIAIKWPFLEAKVSLNGDTGSNVAIPPGAIVRGDVVWKNNLPTRITNAEVSIEFSGNALDRASVTAEHGFYNSSENRIIWDKNNIDDFQMVEPGGTGKFSFAFTPMPLFSASNGMLSNPTVHLKVTVKGNVSTSDPNGGSNSVTTEKDAKVTTDFQLISRALYSIGPFTNTGPIPPVAEKETTYTVLWNVTNSANNVSGAKVTATLPPYISWTGQTSPSSEDISYDETSRTVTWSLNTVYAGVGYGSAAREAVFQIKLVPSLSHVGSPVRLTNDILLTGTDSFTKASLKSARDSMTTEIRGDPNFKQNDGIVVSPK